MSETREVERIFAYENRIAELMAENAALKLVRDTAQAVVDMWTEQEFQMLEKREAALQDALLEASHE